MKTQRRWRAFLPLIIAGIGVVLFSTAGITAIAGWRSAAPGGAGEPVALHDSAEGMAQAVALTEYTTQRRAKARANGRCAECGQIVSMSKINRHDNDASIDLAGALTHANRDQKLLSMTTRHEITVRMTDGSSRVINSVSPASWRVGERVIVIAGTIPPR